MMQILILVLFGLLFPTLATAYTSVPCTEGETGTCRQVANLTLTEVQSAVTASAASDGTYYRDGVYLIAGSATWSSALNISGKHGLVVKGGVGGTTNISCITCIDNTATHRTRVTGTTWTGTGAGYAWSCSGVSNDVRFDHNNMRGTFYYAMTTTNPSKCRGVVVHNDISIFPGGNVGGGFYFRGQDANCDAYLVPVDFGSAAWLFVEDNSFIVNSDTDYFETHWGGKAVFRHNTVSEGTNAIESFFDQHNTSAAVCGGSGTGGRAVIINDNIINYTRNDGNFRRHFYFRSGTGLVYNNMMDYHLSTKPDPILQFKNYRAASSCNDGSTNTASIAASKLCPTCVARCAATTYTEGSLRGEGYPNVGGVAVGVWGGTREPWYIWNNRFIASGTTQTYWQLSDIDVGASEAWSIANNRDYCFSSTTQPTSCGGVPLSYTEYPYPHPLQTGGQGGGGDITAPLAPTGLSIR